jgi:hypothetical protein
MVGGSIGISAPLARFPVERYDEWGEQVRAIAEEISARLSMEPEKQLRHTPVIFFCSLGVRDGW